MYHDVIGQKQVTWGPPLLELFKLVHLGTLSPYSPSIGPPTLQRPPDTHL